VEKLRRSFPADPLYAWRNFRIDRNSTSRIWPAAAEIAVACLHYLQLRLAGRLHRLQARRPTTTQGETHMYGKGTVEVLQVLALPRPW
jgi:hypothetical protein